MALDTDLEQLIYSHQRAMAGPLFETFADRVVAQVRASIERLATYDLANPAHRALCRERDLLRLLLSHVGRENAVSMAYVAEQLGVTEREVKGIVHDLRTTGIQIGASRNSSAGGYYLITDEEESRDTARQMVHQAISMLRTARALRGQQTVAELLGQVRLEMDGRA